MRGAVLALLTAILASAVAGAADLTLTERSAVELAVRQNLSLAAARLELDAKRLTADTAWGGLFPGLSLGAGVTRANSAISVPPPGSSYNWSASATLGAGVTLSAAAIEAVHTARLDYEAGRISFEEARDRITMQARRSFYQLILLSRQLEVTEASIATAQQTLDQTQSDYKNGRVQQLTVRQAELGVRSAKLLLERETVQRENALAQFKDLLGISPATTVELSGTIETVPVALAKSALSSRLEERPDVRAMTAEIALEESRKRAEYLGLLWPALTVSASFSPAVADPLTFGNPPGSGWNDRGSLSISLSASSLLAFLPFVPQNVALRSADKVIRSLRIRRQGLLTSAATEVDSLVRTLEASRAAIASLEASVNLAQESYDLTKEAYGLGTVDFLTLKSAEDDLLQARYELLSEQYTYLASLIGLEYATGLDLRGAKE